MLKYILSEKTITRGHIVKRHLCYFFNQDIVQIDGMRQYEKYFFIVFLLCQLVFDFHNPALVSVMLYYTYFSLGFFLYSRKGFHTQSSLSTHCVWTGKMISSKCDILTAVAHTQTPLMTALNGVVYSQTVHFYLCLFSFLPPCVFLLLAKSQIYLWNFPSHTSSNHSFLLTTLQTPKNWGILFGSSRLLNSFPLSQLVLQIALNSAE